MNALSLYHNLKKRNVNLKPDGGRLVVDAPAGELTAEDKAALADFKPLLLKLLSKRSAPVEEFRDGGRRFDARPSHYPGYTALYDPIEGKWHDFSTKNCYPSIVELANRKRKEARREARGSSV